MIKNDNFVIARRDANNMLWEYVLASGFSIPVCAPTFEIDGADVSDFALVGDTPQAVPIRAGTVEYRWPALSPTYGLRLVVIFVVADQSPIVRFRYVLESDTPRRLTKTSGRDAIAYLSTRLNAAKDVTEVRFSEFNEMVHSFCLSERQISNRDFLAALSLTGPMLAWEGDGESALVAYEHGAQIPDRFLRFDLSPDGNVALCAEKGNYPSNAIIGPHMPFTSIWFQIGGVSGSPDDLAAAYRRFVLEFQSPNVESRKPYLFYNTWNFQERNRWWHGQPYLQSMTQERVLAEIDVAHELGIDVYVIDTGWFEKTGDWRVNRKRFPDGMKAVKQRLDSYGMKLGLWFDPTAAAVSSAMLANHTDCVRSWHGKLSDPHGIWETEDSVSMCLPSRYHEAFADELIRLAKDVGVTYFKWDAIHQYGCDGAGHGHGDETNSQQERADCYAFELGRAMSNVVDRLCAACPEAIVDFDITEGGRCVGLGFLSSGKYFLINNGPYYRSYNIGCPPADGNPNLFFWPGPARAWVCRTPLTFDKWIPSVLFLTHYLPDDPADSQWINCASLILGQNGIWGDLPAISAEGRKRIASVTSRYKQIRDAITASPSVRTGAVGGSPEIYEKIDPATKQGVVALFSSARGTYTYVTAGAVDQHIWSNGADVSFDTGGRAVITVNFTDPSARIVFFGVAEPE